MFENLPGFSLDEDTPWRESIPLATFNSNERSAERRSLLDVVGSRFATVHISARDLASNGKPVNVTTLIEEQVAEIGLGMPTLVVVTKNGITLIWVWDSEGNLRAENDLGPFALRILQNQLGKDPKFLPNLGKRLTVFTRQFPIRMRFNRVVYIKCEPLLNEAGEIIGAVALEAIPVPVVGVIVVGVMPKTDILDGCFHVRRGLLSEGIFDLHAEMTGGMTLEQAGLIKNNGQRRRVIKELRKALEVMHRLQHANIWNGRCIGPDMEDEIGGFIKGDFLATGDLPNFPAGIDILCDGNAIKPELYTTDGSFWLLADVQHDDREIRWSDRQSKVHHWNWLLSARCKPALRTASKMTLVDLMNNREPEFTKFQKVSIEKMFEDSSINSYAVQYELMRNACVLNMSPSAIAGVIEQRWLKKLAPKTRFNQQQGVWEDVNDTRKFPVPASEFRSVKPLCQGKIAGYVPATASMEDGYWTSMRFGVTCNDVTFKYLAFMSGGADQDDHWALIHCIAASDAEIMLWPGKTIAVKAGDVFTVFYRLPIGVSSNAVEVLEDVDGIPVKRLVGQMGSEYMILLPTEYQAAYLQNKHNIPVVEINNPARPLRKDELDWSAFPCPATCTEQEDHTLGHPPFMPTEPVIVDSAGNPVTSYTWTVAMAQGQNLAKVQSMGGVGARANMEMILFEHGILFPFRCHTETWVDLFTKSIAHPSDIDKFITYNRIDATEILIQSKNGNRIDAVAALRIARSYKAGNRPWVTSTDRIFTDAMREHKDIIQMTKRELAAAIRQINAEMRNLLKDVAIGPLTVRRAGSPYQNGCALPPLFEKINFDEGVLKDLKLAYGIDVVKTATGAFAKLSFDDHDQIGNQAVASMRTFGLDNAGIKVFIKQTLAWIYCSGQKNFDDHVLFNGALLPLTVEVLQELRP